MVRSGGVYRFHKWDQINIIGYYGMIRKYLIIVFKDFCGFNFVNYYFPNQLSNIQ